MCGPLLGAPSILPLYSSSPCATAFVALHIPAHTASLCMCHAAACCVFSAAQGSVLNATGFVAQYVCSMWDILVCALSRGSYCSACSSLPCVCCVAPCSFYFAPPCFSSLCHLVSAPFCCVFMFWWFLPQCSIDPSLSGAFSSAFSLFVWMYSSSLPYLGVRYFVLIFYSLLFLLPVLSAAAGGIVWIIGLFCLFRAFFFGSH